MPGVCGGAARQVARVAVAQVERRDRVVVVGRVQGVVGRVDLAAEFAPLGSPGSVPIGRSLRARSRCRCSHRTPPPLPISVPGPTYTVWVAWLSVDVLRVRLPTLTVGGVGQARRQIGPLQVALSIIETWSCPQFGAESSRRTRCGWHVGEGSRMAPAPTATSRASARTRRVPCVAGRAVEHRDGVVAEVGHVHGVGPLVDRDRRREFPTVIVGHGPLHREHVPRIAVGARRSPRPCSRRRSAHSRYPRSRRRSCASPCRPRPRRPVPHRRRPHQRGPEPKRSSGHAATQPTELRPREPETRAEQAPGPVLPRRQTRRGSREHRSAATAVERDRPARRGGRRRQDDDNADRCQREPSSGRHVN